MYSIHSIRQPLPVASWVSFSSNYYFTSSESSTAIFPMRIYRKRLGTRLFFPTSPYRNPVSDATSHLRPLHKLQDSYLRLEKETNTKDCQKPTCWTPATASGLVAESIDLGQKDKGEKMWGIWGTVSENVVAFLIRTWCTSNTNVEVPWGAKFIYSNKSRALHFRRLEGRQRVWLQ